MNLFYLMEIIYIGIIIAVIFKFIGLFINEDIYEKKIGLNRKHIFEVSNLFFQLSIVLTGIVLILHAHNVVNTIDLKYK